MNIRTAKVLEMDDDIHVGPQCRARHHGGRGQSAGSRHDGLRCAHGKGRGGRRRTCRLGRWRFADFREEAIAAARAERLFGIAVPREFGGEGAGIAEVIDVCYTLGRACASTAMIYAMHQAKLACIVRHGRSELLAPTFAAPALQRTDAAGVLHYGRAGRRRSPQQHSRDRVRRLAHHARPASDRHLLRQRRRRHRHDCAALCRSREFRPGARHVPQAGLHAGAFERLGRTRHARHLQRRFQTRRLRLERTDTAGEL